MKIKKEGFTLVEIMIVVAIIALLAAIAIPNLLRAKISANESAAMTTLKTLSTSSETYASANDGQYPTDETSLMETTPPYINKSLCDVTISGYVATCDFGTGGEGYTITADPVSPISGTRTFTISTGGTLSGQ